MGLVRDGALAQCCWAEYALELWGDWDLLEETIDNDHSGSVDFVAAKRFDDGSVRFLRGDWGWGSCPGCDGWDGALPDEIREEMKRCGAEFSGIEAFERYCTECVAGAGAFGHPAARWLELAHSWLEGKER